MQEPVSDRTPPKWSGARLTRHADYQRVYQHSRKHFSASMTYFFSPRSADLPAFDGPRIGLTAGRVLGKAVERNRIKRRMREAVRHNLGGLQSNVDVVLHPRKSVLEMDFLSLDGEIGRVFAAIETSLKKELQKADA